MCLPDKTDRSDPSARSMFGLGAAIVAVAFCAAVPAVAVAARPRSARRRPTL